MFRYLFAGLVFLGGTLAQSQSPVQNNTIAVEGKAELVATADGASFGFKVKGFGSTLRQAAEDAVRKSTSIVDSLNRLGIPSSNIELSSFQSGEGNDKAFLSSSRDFQSIILATVNVDDLSVLDEAVFLVADGPIISMGEVSFSISNHAELKKEALILALRDAQTLASRIAEEFGLTLKEVIRIDTTDDSAKINIRGGRQADYIITLLHEKTMLISTTVIVVYGI